MDKDEIIKTVTVDENKIVCRTCKHKNSGSEYPHFTKAHCGIYREGIGHKPTAVLFDGKDCRFYEKERGTK